MPDEVIAGLVQYGGGSRAAACMMRFGLTRNSSGSALPLPPNSGLPELGILD
jgi:hypothetical protein